MTAPYKALQQATKWLDQQEACQLLNISKRTLQTYRAKVFLEQRKSIGKRISDYPKWSYLCRRATIKKAKEMKQIGNSNEDMRL
jgi:hypothetical protein